jgi:hypothetical protein
MVLSGGIFSVATIAIAIYLVFKIKWSKKNLIGKTFLIYVTATSWNPWHILVNWLFGTKLIDDDDELKKIKKPRKPGQLTDFE